MSITDELRRFANGSDWIGCTASVTARKMLDVADRIDAEHEKRIASVMNDALYHANEKDMADLGWIRLPKDADGVPIHIGDELDGYGYPKGGAYCKAIVNEVTILAGPKDSSYRSWLVWDATEVHHHHEPTVEDVLREFTDVIVEWERDRRTIAETGTWSLETSERDGNFNPTAFTHAHTAEEIVRDLTLGRITEKEAVKRIEELRNE